MVSLNQKRMGGRIRDCYVVRVVLYLIVFDGDGNDDCCSYDAPVACAIVMLTPSLAWILGNILTLRLDGCSTLPCEERARSLQPNNVPIPSAMSLLRGDPCSVRSVRSHVAPLARFLSRSPFASASLVANKISCFLSPIHSIIIFCTFLYSAI